MRAVVVLTLLSVTAVARAHDLDPSLLEVRERGGGAYHVTWKTPSEGEAGSLDELRLVFPSRCQRASSRRHQLERGMLEVFEMRCHGGDLAAETIGVAGLEGSSGEVLATFVALSGESETQLLRAGSPELAVRGARPPATDAFVSYVRGGITHILLGFDHLLFVLGLLLLMRSKRALLVTLTSFTLGHSVTIAAASLGLVSVSQPPIELLIALSIVVLAREGLAKKSAEESLTRRAPWVVAAGFGLIHGFGLAGALRDLGIPRDDLALGLFGFNVGVELGQIAFVAVVLAFALVVKRARVPERVLRVGAAYAMGAFAIAWALERAQALALG